MTATTHAMRYQVARPNKGGSTIARVMWVAVVPLAAPAAVVTGRFS